MRHFSGWVDLRFLPLRVGEVGRLLAFRRTFLRRLRSISDPSPSDGVQPVCPGGGPGGRGASAVDPISSRASVISPGEGERSVRVSPPSTTFSMGCAGAVLVVAGGRNADLSPTLVLLVWGSSDGGS